MKYTSFLVGFVAAASAIVITDKLGRRYNSFIEFMFATAGIGAAAAIVGGMIDSVRP